MENLLKKLEELRERFLKTKALLDIDRKTVQEKELRLRMSEPDFWDDRESAVKIGREAEELSLETKEWRALEKEIREAEEMAALASHEAEASSEANGELATDMEKKYLELEDKFTHLEFVSLFSEKYDHDNALIAIHAGTGGIDAQDWAQMLERMYLRFAERQGWKAEIMDRNYGNEAGIKSSVIRISGVWV